MKYLAKFAAAALALLMIINLAACGGNKDSGGAKVPDGVMSSDELNDGTAIWKSDDGSQLSLDIDDYTYTYRTWYGRIGQGELYESEQGKNGLQLDYYDGTYYFIKSEGGFTLENANGYGDGELNGMLFTASDEEIPDIPLNRLDGIWQNALGETLAINTEKMQYIACSPDNTGSGTIDDKNDGRGPYLFLNGYAFPRITYDGNSFELFFEKSDTQSPNGTYSGVFYRDGNAAEYANLDKAEFVEQNGRLWYYDGAVYFAVPEGYTVGDDGLAYDEAGNAFGAGWEAPIYDPAANYGDGWADNWDE